MNVSGSSAKGKQTVQEAKRPGQEEFEAKQAALNAQLAPDRSEDPELSRYPETLSAHHLFRATQQPASEFTAPGGQLESSTHYKAKIGAIHVSADDKKKFSLRSHQEGKPSPYTSMTPSAESVEEFGAKFGRSTVAVTDGMPAGRYLNGLGYSDPVPAASTEKQSARAKFSAGLATAKRKLGGKDDRPVTPYAVPPGYMKQNEVAVPGNIPTEQVRGTLEIDQREGKIDYESYEENPEYKAPSDYKQD